MRTAVLGVGLVAAVLAAALVAGCAAAEDRLEAPDMATVDEDAAEAPAVERADDHLGREDADRAGGASGEAGDDGVVRLASAAPDRVIRDASLELVVDDADEAVGRIGEIAADADGFVSGAELRRGGVDRPRPPIAEDGHADGDRPRPPTAEEGDADADRPPPLQGTVTIRVASTELDRVLEELREIAVVERSRSISTRDVSGEYADLQARVRNLRTYEDELLSLLATVRDREDASPDELLNVFERVRDVREEIERIEQRLDDLDDRVALSTVTIQLSTAVQTTAVGGEPELWRPFEELRAATTSLVSALQTVGTGLIWFAVLVLPVAALVALPAAAIGYAVVRRRRRDAAPSEDVTPAEA